ncbi:helix-turn-helix domain-containing protein [Paractinoplanes rishiriensis]|uniref:helix-turn-helix domain-containing protein n=1 Tax=Paractinoplanes rishiriensis TaxID=1050105 RepID=UPI001940EA27|nr:helix-turn-helix domain-containing protein [Actinoplanes rishiriensis]
MAPLVLDSTTVAPADRLDHTREALAALPVPLEFELAGPSARVRANRLEAAVLGAVSVAQVTHVVDGGALVDRTPRMIKRSDPEIYRIMVHLTGSDLMTQDGREAALARRGLAVFDSSRPFRVHYLPGRIPGRENVHRYAMLTFPRSLLSVDPRIMRAATGVRLDGTSPLGSLVHSFATRLARDAERYGPADGARLATTVLDLLAVWLTGEFDGAGLPAEAHGQALLAQSQAFISEHLADPMLSPHTVAGAHHVSLRTLQSQFAAQGLTVTGWIRQRRLEACRRDLANPRLAEVAVASIGRRWGFESAAHFSRLFRQAYGMSPRAFRALAVEVTRRT